MERFKFHNSLRPEFSVFRVEMSRHDIFELVEELNQKAYSCTLIF